MELVKMKGEGERIFLESDEERQIYNDLKKKNPNMGYLEFFKLLKKTLPITNPS